MNFSVDISEDITYETTISVNDLNQIITANQIDSLLIELIEDTVKSINLSEEIISSIFTVISGGNLRITFLQEVLKKCLSEKYNNKNDILRTLNMDENVACGCCYYGLILNDIWKYNVLENSRMFQKVEKSLLFEKQKQINIEVYIFFIFFYYYFYYENRSKVVDFIISNNNNQNQDLINYIRKHLNNIEYQYSFKYNNNNISKDYESLVNQLSYLSSIITIFKDSNTSYHKVSPDLDCHPIKLSLSNHSTTLEEELHKEENNKSCNTIIYNYLYIFIFIIFIYLFY